MAVHLDHARPQLTRQTVATLAILRLDIVGQAVNRVIGDLDRLLFAVELHDRQNRPKDFLARDGHVGGHVCKDGGFDKEPAVQAVGPSGAARNQTRAFVDALLDQVLNLVELRFIDHGADMTPIFGGRTNGNLRRHSACFFDGFVIDIRLHQHTAGGVTRLASVVHHVQHAAFDSLVIRIVEDDVRAFATQFKVDLFQRIRRRFRDQRARAGGAGEADHVDVFMRRHLAADTDAIAVHKVEYPFGEACLVNQFGKDHRVQRAFLGRFQHHRAARYDRRADLERDLVHRPVPRRDQTGNAHGFADDPVIRGVIAKRLFEFELFRGLDEVAQVIRAGTNLRCAGQIHRRTHGRAHRFGQILGAGLIDL